MRWPGTRTSLVGVAGLLLVQAGCAGLNGFNLSAIMSTAQTPWMAWNEQSSDPVVQASLEMADRYYKEGKDTSAIAQYENVLRLEPSNKRALRRLAILYDRTAAFSKADTIYKQLAQVQPRNADLFNNWGYSYYLRNNFIEAEKQFRHALKLKRDHKEAAANLGLALGQQERYQEAFKAFREAGLSEADAHCNLGFVYACKGKLEEAQRECELALKADPSCVKARDLSQRLANPRPRESADDVPVPGNPKFMMKRNATKKAAKPSTKPESSIPDRPKDAVQPTLPVSTESLAPVQAGPRVAADSADGPLLPLP